MVWGYGLGVRGGLYRGVSGEGMAPCHGLQTLASRSKVCMIDCSGIASLHVNDIEHAVLQR